MRTWVATGLHNLKGPLTEALKPQAPSISVCKFFVDVDLGRHQTCHLESS